MIAAAALLAALAAAPTFTIDANSNPAVAWATRVLDDQEQPCWKRAMAAHLIAGEAGTFVARTTPYSPDEALDPGVGGGWSPAWSLGRRLRYGDVAASRAWPFGTVFFAGPPFNRTWVVVDRGGAVRSRTHIDVCLPRRPEWRAYHRWDAAYHEAHPNEKYTWLRVWVLGRITTREAR